MKISAVLFVLLFIMLVVSGCSVIETIFKAGMAWAFFLVSFIVVLAIFFALKSRRK